MQKEEIAKILKATRESANMKRQEVADALNVSVKTIGHWETGYAQPDADTLFKLCDMYGTTVDEAFGFQKQKSETFKTEVDGWLLASELMSKGHDDISQMFLTLSEDDKQMVRSFIERLYKGGISEH